MCFIHINVHSLINKIGAIRPWAKMTENDILNFTDVAQTFNYEQYDSHRRVQYL